MSSESNLYINKHFSLYNGKMQITSEKDAILFTDSTFSNKYIEQPVIKSLFNSYSQQVNVLLKTCLRISKHPQIPAEAMVKILLPLLEKAINYQSNIPSYFNDSATNATRANNGSLKEFLIQQHNRFITHVLSGNSASTYLEWILENIQRWIKAESQLYIIQAVEHQDTTLNSFSLLVNGYDQIKIEFPTTSLYMQAIFDDGDLYTTPSDAQDLNEQYSRALFDSYTEIQCDVNRILSNWPQWGDIYESQSSEIMNFIPLHSSNSKYAQKLAQFRSIYANIFDWTLKGYFDILRLLTSKKNWTQAECLRMADSFRDNANNYERPTNVVTLILAEMAINNVYEDILYPGLSPYMPYNPHQFKLDIANILFPFLTLAFFQNENNEVYFLANNHSTYNIFSAFDMSMQRNGDDYYLSIESIRRGKNDYISILRKENSHILIPQELVARGFTMKDRFI